MDVGMERNQTKLVEQMKWFSLKKKTRQNWLFTRDKNRYQNFEMKPKLCSDRHNKMHKKTIYITIFEWYSFESKKRNWRGKTSFLYKLLPKLIEWNKYFELNCKEDRGK